MSYVSENLLPSETIEFEWKIHSYYTFINMIWLSICLLFLLIGFKWWVFVIATGLFFICIFGYNILYINAIEIVITNKRVIYKTWVIWRDIFELQLSKVESARLDQTIFQRIIWAWTLVISWTGWHNKPIYNLANPTDIKNYVYNQIEKNA